MGRLTLKTLLSTNNGAADAEMTFQTSRTQLVDNGGAAGAEQVISGGGREEGLCQEPPVVMT